MLTRLVFFRAPRVQPGLPRPRPPHCDRRSKCGVVSLRGLELMHQLLRTTEHSRETTALQLLEASWSRRSCRHSHPAHCQTTAEGPAAHTRCQPQPESLWKLARNSPSQPPHSHTRLPVHSLHHSLSPPGRRSLQVCRPSESACCACTSLQGSPLPHARPERRPGPLGPAICRPPTHGLLPPRARAPPTARQQTLPTPADCAPALLPPSAAASTPPPLASNHVHQEPLHPGHRRPEQRCAAAAG